MRSLELEGVVLQRKKINDQDCYLSVFTRQRGRVEIYARGANHPKNPLNVGSSPFSYGLYQTSGSRLQLRSVMVIDSFYNLRKDFSVMLMASFFSKSYLYLYGENQPSIEAFELLVNSLSVLKKFPLLKEKLLVYFLANTVRILGIMPDLSCIKEGEIGYKLLVETGEVIAQGRDGEALLIWQNAINMKISSFLNLNHNNEDLEKLVEIIEEFVYKQMDVNLPALHREMKNYL